MIFSEYKSIENQLIDFRLFNDFKFFFVFLFIFYLKELNILLNYNFENCYLLIFKINKKKKNSIVSLKKDS